MELINTLLHNPFVLVVVSAAVVMVIMFLDSKINRTYLTNSTYYKNMGLVSSMVGLSLFSTKFNFNKKNNNEQTVMGGGEPSSNKQEYEMYNDKFDD
jgi:hypothetical protein